MSTAFDSNDFSIIILLLRLLATLILVSMILPLKSSFSYSFFILLIDSCNEDCLKGLIFDTLGVGFLVARDDYLLHSAYLSGVINLLILVLLPTYLVLLGGYSC